MRELFLNVRVSVRTPFSLVVIISESSGPAVVVDAVLPVFAFALVLAVLSVLEQLAARTASDKIAIIVRNLLITAFASSY
jgi:hypothetical protein